jgi:hypothetical protein
MKTKKEDLRRKGLGLSREEESALRDQAAIVILPHLIPNPAGIALAEFTAMLAAREM